MYIYNCVNTIAQKVQLPRNLMLQISWQSYCHLKSNKRVAKGGQELLKLLKKKCYFWEVSALFTKTVSF